MEIKAYLFLLIIISAITLIYWTLGSSQINQEIISQDFTQFKDLKSDNIYKPTIKQCPYCKGNGIIECPQCKGSGKIIISTYCNECEGTGKIYQNHTIINCPYCHEGTIETQNTCNKCNGTGNIKCPECSGKGIIKS